MKRDLSHLATGDLKAVLQRLQQAQVGPPWSKSFAFDGQALASALAAFDDVDVVALCAVVEAVLAERQRPRPEPEIVWTGPEPIASTARDTAAVVRGMLQAAQREVLISCYSLDVAVDDQALFEPLHYAMSTRGVTATIFFDLERCAKTAKCSLLEATNSAVFYSLYWTFGAPYPRLAYDPRALPPAQPCSMHAKLVVVDQRFVLVGSANLTDRGQTRNVELGLKIDDALLASRIHAHWMGAVTAGRFHYCK